MADINTAADTIEDSLQAGDRVRLSDIDWDTSGGDDDGADEPDLPETVEMTLPAGWTEDDSLADLLSDSHGFCVSGIGRVERL